jgi:pimeloyl-ACP methyl ester carboxylesterase
LTTPAGGVFVRSAPGDGPTILLVHGYPSCSFDYQQAVPQLDGRG